MGKDVCKAIYRPKYGESKKVFEIWQFFRYFLNTIFRPKYVHILKNFHITLTKYGDFFKDHLPTIICRLEDFLINFSNFFRPKYVDILVIFLRPKYMDLKKIYQRPYSDQIMWIIKQFFQDHFSTKICGFKKIIDLIIEIF